MSLIIVVGKEQAVREILTRLVSIEEKINQIIIKEGKIMADLDQVLTSVNDESTLEDSIITLLNGIKAQLAAALAGTTISPATQAKIDAVFTAVEANKAKVSAALVANTPAA